MRDSFSSAALRCAYADNKLKLKATRREVFEFLEGMETVYSILAEISNKSITDLTY